MGLQAAIAVTLELRDALAAELDRARQERELLRALDTDRLLERATFRRQFNAMVLRLQRELAAALEASKIEYGLQEASLESLATRAPEETAELGANLAEIRSLAAALKELDELNALLTKRALQCVQGYLAAVCRRPVAYTRHGQQADESVPTSATFSRRF